MPTDNEMRYYDTLKHIATGYQTPAQLRRNSERQYGLDYAEALEYAYENVIDEARRAIKGKRRPTPRPVEPSPNPVSTEAGRQIVQPKRTL